MATIRETIAADKKRREQEAKDDAEAQRKIDAIRNKRKPKRKPEKKKSKSFLDKIRDALSTEDSDADAIEAIERGISEADAANKD